MQKWKINRTLHNGWKEKWKTNGQLPEGWIDRTEKWKINRALPNGWKLNLQWTRGHRGVQNLGGELLCFQQPSKVGESPKDIKNEILILIHMLEEDPEMENAMREAVMKAEKYEKDALENFLELMVSKEYHSIFDIYK